MRIAPSTKVTRLGDIVAAAFDKATLVTANPGQQAHLAVSRLGRLLARSHDTRLMRLLCQSTKVRASRERHSR
jgi:hypothetical protein